MKIGSSAFSQKVGKYFLVTKYSLHWCIDQKKKARNKMDKWFLVVIFMVLVFGGIVIALNPKLAESSETPPFTDANCIRAIMGEASGCGEQGMLDIASAIRNKGNLKGVYGYRAKHIYEESAKTWGMATQAWFEAKDHRTHTGQFWGSIKYDQKWIAEMRRYGYIEVLSRNGHTFFKSVEIC